MVCFRPVSGFPGTGFCVFRGRIFINAWHGHARHIYTGNEEDNEDAAYWFVSMDAEPVATGDRCQHGSSITGRSCQTSGTHDGKSGHVPDERTAGATAAGNPDPAGSAGSAGIPVSQALSETAGPAGQSAETAGSVVCTSERKGIGAGRIVR